MLYDIIIQVNNNTFKVYIEYRYKTTDEIFGEDNFPY